jgi:ribose/xylose/arabinose/galactoside ABC-type transport system permease subunit
VSEPPVHPEPGEPVDASGVTRPWPAGRPRRLESPQDQPSGEQPYDQPGQPVVPANQPGAAPTQPGLGPTQPSLGPTQPSLGPTQPGTQYNVAGSPQLLPGMSPATPDRVAVHLIWEAVLLVLAAAFVGVALASTDGAHLVDILRPAGYLGLVAAGLALSMRTATPNLAVGSIATAAGVIGAHLVSANGWSLWVAMAVAVAMAVVVGLVTGLVVAGLSVPAWAATLAVALLVQAAALGISNGQPITYQGTGSYPATLWLVVFAAVSIGGGAIWLAPAIRSTLSATRSAGDPGRWAGLPAGFGAVAGLTGSSLLAGVGGVSLTIYLGVGDPNSGGINLTLIALAAVLVGGVSVFGRRAGVLGTVFGVVIAQTMLFLLNVHTVAPYWIDVAIGGLLVLGLCVSRSLESIANALSRRPAG